MPDLDSLLTANLADTANRLVLADALEDAGRVGESAFCRCLHRSIRVADGIVCLEGDGVIAPEYHAYWRSGIYVAYHARIVSRVWDARRDCWDNTSVVLLRAMTHAEVKEKGYQ